MELYSHLSSLQVSKPSVFEIFAVESLESLLKPSVLYALSLTTQRYPRYLLRILNHFDSIYTGLHAMIEYYYLKEWGIC